MRKEIECISAWKTDTYEPRSNDYETGRVGAVIRPVFTAVYSNTEYFIENLSIILSVGIIKLLSISLQHFTE